MHIKLHAGMSERQRAGECRSILSERQMMQKPVGRVLSKLQVTNIIIIHVINSNDCKTFYSCSVESNKQVNWGKREEKNCFRVVKNKFSLPGSATHDRGPSCGWFDTKMTFGVIQR